MFYIYITNIIHFYVSAKFFINYMKSLLEELDRIKNLMVYEKGKPINEVSTKVVKTTASTSQSTAPKTKDVSTTILKALKKEENCVLVTHIENFNVNITVGEGAKKFHDKFINVLKEKFGDDLTGGHLDLSDVKVFGGASNYNGGKVKPEWCNEYDVSKGTTSLKKWSDKCAGFGDIEYKGNSGGTTRNKKLAYLVSCKLDLFHTNIIVKKIFATV